MCLGAIDGKHIAIQQPKNSGSEFFNYKGYFSILLLAIASHEYKFLYVDVGASGRNGDAGVFDNSELKKMMDEGSMGFPEPEELGETGLSCNYHIIGDDAFPLRKDVMKPFPFRQLHYERHIYNYRLSRARRVVENAFGIMANRFRVFLTKIELEPEKAKMITLAACCLHNMLIEKQGSYTSNGIDHENENHDMIPGTWRMDPQLATMETTHNRNFSFSSKGQRNLLKTFFNSRVGSVPWQDSMVSLNKQ